MSLVTCEPFSSSNPLADVGQGRVTIYEGEEPDLGKWSIEDVLIEVEETVEIAEGEAS